VVTAQSGAVRPTFLGVLLCSPKERKPHRVWFGYSDGLVKTARPVRLAAFDLDGTLLRGDTVCEVLARTLGHLERMRELEAIQEARQDRDSLLVLRKELAAYYQGVPALELRSYLSTLTLAPGAREGFALLRRAGIVTAIVSITWEFAAQWLAAEVGADYHVGTRLLADGSIEHFWPEDKAVWLAALRRRHGIGRDETVAVGDSWRDVPMLETAGVRVYVGKVLPPGLTAIHLPDGDIGEVARVVTRWPSVSA
jgi:HAD superfamily phosphoserine phosphatase-like hydrolase